MRVLAVVWVLVCVGCQAGEHADTGDPLTGASMPMPTTVDHDNVSVLCRPEAEPATGCIDGDICCSDDPASTRGLLPLYFDYNPPDPENFGVPIFSADNNVLSYSGHCLQAGEASPSLANGCPRACNPTWGGAQQRRICGELGLCCPSRDVDPERDCVLDPESGRWRTVRASDVPALSMWGDQHTTNQDPRGESCMKFAAADGQVDAAVLADCLAQRTVADQRGFCATVVGCGCSEDLCDAKNPGWTPRCGPI